MIDAGRFEERRPGRAQGAGLLGGPPAGVRACLVMHAVHIHADAVEVWQQVLLLDLEEEVFGRGNGFLEIDPWPKLGRDLAQVAVDVEFLHRPAAFLQEAAGAPDGADDAAAAFGPTQTERFEVAFLGLEPGSPFLGRARAEAERHANIIMISTKSLVQATGMTVKRLPGTSSSRNACASFFTLISLAWDEVELSGTLTRSTGCGRPPQAMSEESAKASPSLVTGRLLPLVGRLAPEETPAQGVVVTDGLEAGVLDLLDFGFPRRPPGRHARQALGFSLEAPATLL